MNATQCLNSYLKVTKHLILGMTLSVLLPITQPGWLQNKGWMWKGYFVALGTFHFHPLKPSLLATNFVNRTLKEL